MQIIKIAEAEIAGAVVQTVNARDLHAFLEVGKDFSTWIKDRIAQFSFLDGADFVTESRSPVSGSGNRGAATDYFLSLDMAKELSMVERNSKGKEARQYFIECERRAKAGPAIDPMQVLNDPAAMRGLLLNYSEKVLALEADKKAMQADVDALARIAKADGSLCLRESAKALQIREKDFISYLVQHKWIFRNHNSGTLQGYAARVQSGDLEHKVTTVLRADGSERVVEQVRVTPQGLSKLAKLFPPPMKVA